MHVLFAYLLCGIVVALMISTIDLLNRKNPDMGVGYTILSGVVWPAFLIIVAAYALGWRPQWRR